MEIKLLLLIIVITILASYLTTKIITIKYFSVIDGYVKGLLEDIKKSIRDATENK